MAAAAIEGRGNAETGEATTFNNGVGITERLLPIDGADNAPPSDGDIGEDIPPSVGTTVIPTGPLENPEAIRTCAALGEAKAVQRSNAMRGWDFMD